MSRARLFKSISSVDNIVAEVQHSGSHFFDPDTRRFFRSRTAPRIFVPLRKDGRARGGYKAFSGPIWFVTSEQYSSDTARLYTVRCFNVRGTKRLPIVSTVGDFQQYQTLRAAYRAAQMAANVNDRGQ